MVNIHPWCCKVIIILIANQSIVTDHGNIHSNFHGDTQVLYSEPVENKDVMRLTVSLE
jgi:hypothetical protein